MGRKIIVDIEKPLKGQVLIWKDDEVIATCDIHTLLPELKVIKEEVAGLKEENELLKHELEAIKKLAEQNARDIRIDRGLEDE